jgi:hypothetical protein
MITDKKMSNEQEATETLLYTFDFPMLTESGSVKITNNQIVLLFPKKTNYLRKRLYKNPP